MDGISLALDRCLVCDLIGSSNPQERAEFRVISAEFRVAAGEIRVISGAFRAKFRAKFGRNLGRNSG